MLIEKADTSALINSQHKQHLKVMTQPTNDLVSVEVGKWHTRCKQRFDKTVSQTVQKQKMAHRPTTFNASSVTGNFFSLRYSSLLLLSFYWS
jgi:hypothetical protein